MRDNVIRSPRFDADRNRRARHLREYGEHLDELNGYPPLPVTREAPVADDISTMTKAATLIVGGLVFAIFLYAWLAGPVEVSL